MKKCTEKMPKSGIYAISSVIDNRIYIGSSKELNERYKRHKSELNRGKHSNQFLTRFVEKYGLDNLKFWVIETCEPEMLMQREQIHIDLLFKNLPKSDIMNMNPIAQNPPQTPETRQKISEAQKGRVPSNKGKKMSEEQRLTLVGRTHSDSTKEKMRDAKLKNPTTYWQGKTHTKETRQKISDVQKGKTISTETRLKKSKKGIWITPSGEEIEILNISEFCRQNGFQKSNFCYAYNGKFKQAYGYKLKQKLE